MGYECYILIVSVTSLFFVFIGGCFALWQWHKGLVYRRAEIVNSLIKDTRENGDVSLILDIADWDEGFYYDGEFVIDRNTCKSQLKNISDDEFFLKIDYTLSIFSHICYLKKVHAITKRDLACFEYELHRLADNEHICNYLYSIYHWSKDINVKMTFDYLVDYCIEKKYLDKSFKDEDSETYTCYLDF